MNTININCHKLVFNKTELKRRVTAFSHTTCEKYFITKLYIITRHAGNTHHIKSVRLHHFRIYLCILLPSITLTISM